MRRIISALLLVTFLLAGCGSESEDGDAPTEEKTEKDEPELVQMLVLTSAGGEVSPRAYFVDDPQQMKAYRKTFEDRDQLTSALEQAVEDAGDREGRLAAATVYIGCDVPSDVTVTQGEGGPEVHPAKVKATTKECFAPMTSVALVEIP